MDIAPWLGEKLYPFSHLLGYRRRQAHRPDEPMVAKQWRSKAWVKKAEHIVQTFVGSWVALALVGLVSKAAAWRGYSVPIIIGSFGAEAVLLFATPTSAMVQPRNIVFGTALSSIIGVGIAKLFALQDEHAFPIYKWDWAAGSTALAVPLAVTQVFDVTHAPGGAAALLAATNQQIVKLGWFYVGYLMVGTVVMLGWSMIINNIGMRRYPQYWISPRWAYKPEEGDREKTNATPSSEENPL